MNYFKYYTCVRASLLWGLLLLAGCTPEFENTFSEDADTRVKAALEEYRQVLLGASAGWEATIYPAAGGAYFYYFEFADDGTVTMVSDFSDSTAENVMTGTYLMKALQRPTLSFDTYSYLHILADPTGSVNGGTDGSGLYSDFEFARTDTHGDTLEVEGIQRYTEMMMVASTASRRSAFLSGSILDSRTWATDYLAAHAFSYFDLGGDAFTAVGYNMTTKMASVIYASGSDIETLTVPFTFSSDGLLFSQAVTTPDLSFQELLWDDTNDTYYITQGGSTLSMESSTTPRAFTTVTPTLANALGSAYTRILIVPDAINGMSDDFLTLYNDASETLEDTYGLYLGYIDITVGATGVAVMNYLMTDGSQSYSCYFQYNISNSSSTVTFGTAVDSYGYASAIEDYITDLQAYFESNTFTVSYLADANLGALMAGMYPQDSPDVFCYGVLE